MCRSAPSSASTDEIVSSPSGGGASGSVEPETPIPDVPANATFPVGSYSFNTYLSTIATNCTTNSATWMCYPYSTYEQDRNDSTATFDWIIRPVPDSSNYTISSTANPFSITFSNISLSLLKPGQADEHYFFQYAMSKPTKPAKQLGDQNVAATCYFKDTTMQAYLYTKQARTYMLDSDVGAFDAWPYAVKVEQVSGAGAGSPECKDPSGNLLGDFSVEDGTQLCDCLYLNTGT